MNNSIQHIHPIIRIACFLAMGSFVVNAQPQYIALSCVLLIMGYMLVKGQNLAIGWKIILRLKWLLLSILSIYLFMTPGQPLFEFTGEVVTKEGVTLGLLRVLALIILILAVNLLIRSQQQVELTQAILWYLTPLQRIGLPVERLAVRIVLTMQYVSEFEVLLKNSTEAEAGIETNGQVSEHLKPSIKDRLSQSADKATLLVQAALDRSMNTVCTPIQIQKTTEIHHWQWLLPVMIIAAYSLI